MRKSTNVRLLSLALRVLPTALAARLALRVFMTTRRRRITSPNGRRFTVGDGVTGWWWGDGPPVYLVHGWNGHAGQLAGFVDPLVATGHRVVAFDAPGHGATGGGLSSVAHIADALVAAVGLHGAPRGVVAHSLGAAATALALRRGLPEPDRLVFVGPATRPSRYLRGFLDLLDAPLAVRDAFYAAIRDRLGVAAGEVDIAPVPGVPLLVVHDADDREVPAASACELVKAWPGARLVTTQGLGHRQVLGDPAVVTAASRFLSGITPQRCACGHLAGQCDRCALDRELFRPASRLATA
ncbi:MAG: alpha/beta hydrolase [Myxococcota bacterium]